MTCALQRRRVPLRAEHHVQAHRPALLGEEELAAGLAGDPALQPVRIELSGDTVGIPTGAVQRGAQAFRPELHQRDEDVSRAHPLDRAGAVVAALGGQRRSCPGAGPAGCCSPSQPVPAAPVRPACPRRFFGAEGRGRCRPLVDPALPGRGQLPPRSRARRSVGSASSPALIPCSWRSQSMRSSRRPSVDRRSAPYRLGCPGPIPAASRIRSTSTSRSVSAARLDHRPDRAHGAVAEGLLHQTGDLAAGRCPDPSPLTRPVWPSTTTTYGEPGTS